MKYFLLKTGLFILSLFILYAATWYVVTPEQRELGNDYMAAMIDKHERADKIGSPKIILAGGSNIAFNINSARVQDELNLPVVNIGLNVGLGLNFILEELKDISNENDIIFLFMTYFEDLDGMYALRKHTIEHYGRARKYHQFNLHEELIIHTRDTKNNLRNKIVSGLLSVGSERQRAPNVIKNESVYTRSDFNEFGDFEGHHNLEQPEDLGQRFEFEYSFWEGIEPLNSFNAWAEKNNIQVYYIFPAYPDTEFLKNKSVIKKFEDDLRQNLKMEILGEPKSFLLEENFFYDSIYHLNKDGREIRTSRFICMIINHEMVLSSINEAIRLRKGT